MTMQSGCTQSYPLAHDARVDVSHACLHAEHGRVRRNCLLLQGSRKLQPTHPFFHHVLANAAVERRNYAHSARRLDMLHVALRRCWARRGTPARRAVPGVRQKPVLQLRRVARHACPRPLAHFDTLVG